MLKMILKLLFGFLGSCLFINWLSDIYDHDFTKMAVNFVLDPLNFFQGALLFILTVFFQGELIRYIIAWGKNLLKRETALIKAESVIIVTGLLLNFVVLYVNNVLAANILLLFSLLYGCISVIEQKVKQRNY
jgi:hypothetical protein